LPETNTSALSRKLSLGKKTIFTTRTSGDHGAQGEVRREHLRRRLPPFKTFHRQRWRRRPRQSLRLKAVERNGRDVDDEAEEKF
jgi:hypothetical protein